MFAAVVPLRRNRNGKGSREFFSSTNPSDEVTSCFWAFREKRSADIAPSLKPISVLELLGRSVGREKWPYAVMLEAVSEKGREKALGASEVRVMLVVMVVLEVAVTLEVMVNWDGVSCFANLGWSGRAGLTMSLAVTERTTFVVWVVMSVAADEEIVSWSFPTILRHQRTYYRCPRRSHSLSSVSTNPASKHTP